MTLEPMPYRLIPKRLVSMHQPVVSILAMRLEETYSGTGRNRTALIKAFAPAAIRMAELGHEEELCNAADMVAALSGDQGQVDLLLRQAFRHVSETAKRRCH